MGECSRGIGGGGCQGRASGGRPRNAIYSIYVFQLPAGPVWALHGFYVVSTALMLAWYVRYVVAWRNQSRTRIARSSAPAVDRLSKCRNIGFHRRPVCSASRTTPFGAGSNRVACEPLALLDGRSSTAPSWPPTPRRSRPPPPLAVQSRKAPETGSPDWSPGCSRTR